MSTTLVPQILAKSCWAASLEMFTGGQLTQCQLLADDYLRGRLGQPPAFCDATWQTNNRGRYTGNNQTIDAVDGKLHPPGSNPIPSVLVDDVPSFASLQSNVGSSAITLYAWATASDQHYIVMNGTVEQTLTTSAVVQWVKVLDPFPVGRGRTYYLSYHEFSMPGWFQGIIFHASNRVRNAVTRQVLKGRDAKKLVRKYIDALPPTVTGEFGRVTRVGSSHQILDYNFNVINTNISIALADRSRLVSTILAADRGIKMFLAGSGRDYTSFFLNLDRGSYYISMIENGARYLAVLGNNLAGAIDLAAIGAPVSTRSLVARKIKLLPEEKPDEIESEFLKYFEKYPRTALICRFYDIGQEYVFFIRDGRIRVFDPFKSFTYILPESPKGTTHLSLNEFIEALTQFYLNLNKK